MEGGSYVFDPVTKVRTRVEEPTRSDPRGDAPRSADGTLIGNDGLPLPTTPEPPPAPVASRRTPPAEKES